LTSKRERLNVKKSHTAYVIRLGQEQTSNLWSAKLFITITHPTAMLQSRPI